jgi:hypothetical protein
MSKNYLNDVYSQTKFVSLQQQIIIKNMREKVEEVWKKYNDFEENAEQHMFVQILMYDKMLIPAYNHLQKNWSDAHAEKFINGMTKVVFKKLGIE